MARKSRRTWFLRSLYWELVLRRNARVALGGESMVESLAFLMVAVLPLAQTQPSPQVPLLQDIWRQISIRDQRVASIWNATEEAIEAGDHREAASLIQRILDHRADFQGWISPDAESQGLPPLGYRRVAQNLLMNGPQGLRAAYEESFQADAEALWNEGRTQADLKITIEVVRRYSATPSGREAWLFLAHRYLDRGDYASSSACWQSLWEDPVHRRALGPTERIQAASAFRAAGLNQLADEVIEQLGGRKVRIAGVDGEAGRILKDLTLPPVPALTDYRQPGGQADRNPRIPALMPGTEPIWSVPFIDDPGLRNILEEWTNARYLQDSEPSMPAIPIIVRDRVIVPCSQGIAARDLKTGALLWTHHSPFQWGQALREPVETSASQWWDVMFQRNACTTTFSSDGERIYAVDSIPSYMTLRKISTGVNIEKHEFRNRLVALSLEGNGEGQSRILWNSESVEKGEMADSYFLGPPLVNGSSLYALQEYRDQLQVSMMDASTGNVFWTQPLGLTNPNSQISSSDLSQLVRLTTPLLSSGVLVCPTENGFLLGLHPVTGELRWVFQYLIEPGTTVAPSARRPIRARTSFAHDPTLQGIPLAQNERLYLLPKHSQRLFCLDIRNGEQLWAIPREDALYLAGALNDSLVVVGRRGVRLLDSRTGGLQKQFDSVEAAGRGILTENRLLLPLSGSRMGVFELGPSPTFRIFRSEGVGNMVALPNMLLTVNPDRVTLWPSVNLQTQLLHQADPQAASTIFAKARLALRLRDYKDAYDLLDVPGREFSLAQTEEKNQILREIIRHRWDEEPDSRVLLISQLQSIDLTDQDRLETLVYQARNALDQSDTSTSLNVVEQLIELDQLSPHLLLEREGVGLVSPAAFAAGTLSELRRKGLSSECDQFQNRMFERSEGRWTALLRLFPDSPQADEIRLKLAEKFDKEGKIQAAVLCLQQAQSSLDERIGAEATRRLVELWDETEFFQEAANGLEQLGTIYATTELSTGQTGLEYATEYPNSSISHDLYLSQKRQFENPVLAHFRVEREPIEKFAKPGNENRIRYSTDGTYSIDWFTTTGSDRTLSAFDNATVNQSFDFSLPESSSIPTMSLFRSSGVQYIPVVTSNSISSLSLLHRASVWELDLLQRERRPRIRMVGPYDNRSCFIQSSRTLTMIDPITGTVRWERKDLDPNFGLFVNGVGLFGREREIVVFHQGRSKYEVISKATGERLSSGQVDLDEKRVFVESYGKNAMLQARDNERNVSLILFDPVAGSDLFRLSLSDARYFPMKAEKLLLVERARKSIELVSMDTGEILVDCPIDDLNLDRIAGLEARIDRDLLLVSLNHPSSTNASRSYPSTDAILQTSPMHIRGKVIGINLKSGVREFVFDAERSTLITAPAHRLPVLMIHRRLRTPDNREFLLEIELRSRKDGSVIGTKQISQAGRLIQMIHDGAKGKISLLGDKIQIHLQLSGQKLPAIGDEPL